MLILSEEDIKKCFTMEDAIASCKKAVAMYSSNQTNIPLRSNIEVKKYEGQTLYMPGLTTGSIESSGLKIVSVYPNNIKAGLASVSASMILVDSKTGIVSAILDGTYLTKLRTGAIQGLATEILANKNAKTATLIGAGGQAFMQAVAMLTVRKLERLYIFNFNKERAIKLTSEIKSYMKDKYELEIIISDDVNEAVKNSDIITSVTTSKTPTFDFSYVKKGTHINGVGSYTPSMIELPEEAILNADKIYFDTYAGVLEEAGDILAPIEKSLINHDSFTGEIGELVNKKIIGRESEDEITLFKTVGNAVLDLVTAELIVNKAKQINVGQEIEF